MSDSSINLILALRGESIAKMDRYSLSDPYIVVQLPSRPSLPQWPSAAPLPSNGSINGIGCNSAEWTEVWRSEVHQDKTEVTFASLEAPMTLRVHNDGDITQQKIRVLMFDKDRLSDDFIGGVEVSLGDIWQGAASARIQTTAKPPLVRSNSAAIAKFQTLNRDESGHSSSHFTRVNLTADGAKTPRGWLLLNARLEFLHQVLGNEHVTDVLPSTVNARVLNQWTPLHVAAFHGNEDAVHTLIHLGADVGAVDNAGCTALHRAVAAGHAAIVPVLCEESEYECDGVRTNNVLTHLDKENRSVLITAIALRRFNAVCALLEQGADPSQCDARGWNSLHFAAEASDAVQYLEKLGNALRALNKLADCLEAMTSIRYTPLMVAARNGNLDAVRLLLEWGAVVSGGSSQRSPLLLAAVHGHEEVAELLVRRGASVADTDSDGRTPADIVTSAGSPVWPCLR